MRINALVLLLVASLGGIFPVSAQEASKNVAIAGTEQADRILAMSLPRPLDEVLDRVIDRERDEIQSLRPLKPIVETYMQIQKEDKTLGLVPGSDFYSLGQASFAKQPAVKSLLSHTKTRTIWDTYHAAGFLMMSFVDPFAFDKKHYDFHYTGQAFLGEFRCYVFDVSPRAKTKSYKFRGRIWVEAGDFNIIRINGLFDKRHPLSLKAFQEEENYHLDSWRTNVQPGVWLPSYAYCQEIGA